MLTSCIRRIPPVAESLSADVFIIEGDERVYVFDVGSSDAAYETVSALKKPVMVILSHFHRDHTANMTRLNPDALLVGARTRKTLGRGTLVDAPLRIGDGVTLDVRPCVSPHAPGCLIVTVNGTYTLLGDLHYARPDAGQGEARGMYNVLKGLETQYFVPSHRDGEDAIPKEIFLRDLKAYYHL